MGIGATSQVRGVLASTAQPMRAALTMIAVTVLFGACQSREDQETTAISVIPAPQDVKPVSGHFVLQADTQVSFDSDPQVERIARYFIELVARTGGPVLKAAAGEADSSIRFQLTASGGVPDGEGYSLNVSPQRIVVSADTPRGLFYGAITLWQLMTSRPDETGSSSIPAVTITDQPRFAWRGLMLDVARHYMPPDFVKQMIDWMALHKLNTLHWHLTDDQGWRIEIRKYPQLTDVGAWRIPAGAAGIDPNSGQPRRYGGFYSQDEIRDIVRYAAERYITIVPEIEMPGHAQAAIAAYPELGSRGDRPAVSPDWGIHTYLFNVEDDTFTFLENVLTEVIELFPGPYIHVGGDEAVKDQWQASARVRQRMREFGVATEASLQGYFVARIGRFLSAHQRRLVGWDEILEGGVPPDAVVMSWRGVDGGREAARMGHDVVMAPAPDLYFDHLQSDSASEPPGRPGIESLADVYAFEPIPSGLDAKQARHIIGVQANLWTEHVRTPERVEHAVFPRLAALAEVGWSPAERRNWSDFIQRVAVQLGRYRALGIRYADSAFEVRFTAQYDRQRNALDVKLATQANFGTIRYTLDGTEPTSASRNYDSPIKSTPPLELMAAGFNGSQRLSETRTRIFNAQTLLERQDDELTLCHQKLPLRLEDDAPVDGERAVFLVDIMDPCWIYEGAPLGEIDSIEVAVGQLPYNFQLWKDASGIVTHEPATESGELQVRLDSCTGPVLTSLSLAPAIGHPALSTLTAPLPPRSGMHDLCFMFTGKSQQPLWVIDRIRLRK